MRIAQAALLSCASALCLLFLSARTADAQVPIPQGYLFVEVRDTEGKEVNDAMIEGSDDSGQYTYQVKTDASGKAQTTLTRYDSHHFELRVSKPGYLPFEEVLFLRRDGLREYRLPASIELPFEAPSLQDSQPSPVKIVLRRPPRKRRELEALEAEERRHRLLLAAKRGDAAALRASLAEGVKPDAADARGVPAIVWAAFAGDAETIKALLDAGADVRARLGPAQQALLIYLTDGVTRDGSTRTAINDHSAGQRRLPLQRREEVVRRFIAAGADVNAGSGYRGTVLNRVVELMPYEGFPPQSLSVETAKALIAAGANVSTADAKGQTPLMMAVRHDSLEMIWLLLGAGARASINAKDNQGHTALMSASFLPAEGIKMLLRAGAAVNVRDNKGRTPLMHAVYDYVADRFEAVGILLEAGANVHERDEDGLTPLMMAARNASVKTIALLLKAGARLSINAQDKAGRTALMYGVEFDYQYNPNPELVRILLEAGADARLKDKKGQTALTLARSKYPNDPTIKLLEEAEARH